MEHREMPSSWLMNWEAIRASKRPAIGNRSCCAPQCRLRDRFSLTWFHDMLNEGAMPLAMLEKRVGERIAERAAG